MIRSPWRLLVTGLIALTLVACSGGGGHDFAGTGSGTDGSNAFAAIATLVGAANRLGFLRGPLPGALSYPFGVAVTGHTLYLGTSNAVAQVQNLAIP